MQQTLHKETVKIDKETEFRHTSDGAGKLFTEVLLYQVTLKPGFYRPASGFGAPFVSRAMLTKVAKLFHGGYPTTSIGFALQNGLDGAMYEQIRVASYGAGEMHIALQPKTKVPDVVRPIDRLLHAAQYQLLIQPALMFI